MPNQEYNSNLINYIIQLAQKPNAKESLALLLDNLFDNAQKEKQEEDRKDKAVSSIVLFTTKELSKMPQQFRKMFKTNNIRAHVKRRPDGLYEIRCQINKTLYVATSKYLDVCKEKFIEKLAQSNSLSSCLRQRRQTVKTQTPLMKGFLVVSNHFSI